MNAIKKPNTGGSMNYYKVFVARPITQPEPYTAECGDIIKALKLDWDKANMLKEIFRMGNEQGNGAGKDSDYERAAGKILFFAIQHAREHGIDLEDFIKPLNINTYKE